jgi:thiamine-monophosphate kinase
VNEFELIARFFTRTPRSPSVVRGVGDDAAIVAPSPGHELVVTTDMLVGGRHFFADAEPEALGHKTLAVNLSDVAAMGATPRWAFLALALPENDPAWLAEFARGFFALADAHAVDLVGGDTTRGPLNLCVTLIGEVRAGQAITRAGAQAGDDVYVSGELGDAALAVAARRREIALDREALAHCSERLDRPTPRLGVGAALAGVATAMIDVSDGLTGDLGHILDASNVGALVDLAAIPCSRWLRARRDGPERALVRRCLLAGGDDYELCFTANPSAADRIAAIAANSGVPLTRIGTISTARVLVVRDENGAPIALPRAFDHFAGDAS